tara:strand:+ start:795 stop:1856 length:1062 start_codon:yes stop_codon:yes gene_type:complete
MAMMDCEKNNKVLGQIMSSDLCISIVGGRFCSETSRLPVGVRVFNSHELNTKNNICVEHKKIVANMLSLPNIFIEASGVCKENLNPIYINYLVSAEPDNETLDVSFFIEKNTQISFVEQWCVSDKLHSPLKKVINSRWFIGPGAQLTFFGLNPSNLCEDSFITNNVFLKQKNDSDVSFSTFYWNSGSVHNNLEALLEDPGATCSLNSISLLSNNGCVENNLLIKHLAPNCESSQLYKGVFNDESHGIFNSTVFVEKGAQGTLSKQQNNNILLSDYASISSNPQLEIYADDVSCEHGSTMGQVDSEAVFYLKSRGLNEKLANKMLLSAFLNEVVEEITNTKIKHNILLNLNNLL